MNEAVLDWVRWFIDNGNVEKRKELRKLAAGFAGKRVLDVGCGLGLWCDLLPWNYTGIDINPQYIEYAKKKYGKDFRVMDAGSLPDEEFDLVMLLDIFHHLTKEQVRQAIIEARRVAKGRIIVMDSVVSRNPIQRVVMSFDAGKFIRQTKGIELLTGLRALKEFDSGLYREALFVEDKDK
jgi:2-polyprenyl-3-methyl-5-hydroxy-6-metoxy-1,4-benzoquinol methylase